jgi:DNA-binding CsgD family transcriptional regulator
MARPVEVLDKIAKSDEAVFAFDGNDLVILWNKACERMLGRPAYQVLGHHCYDVMCGRDVYGNRYCCRSCPAISQARNHPSEELNNFLLDVQLPGGETRRLSVKTFAMSSEHPSLSPLVHVLREQDAPASELEMELAEAVASSPAARPSSRKGDREAAPLTTREREILRRMAEGLTTARIAEALSISPVTVRNHIARILSKLDVHTKLAAVAFAYRHGLVGPDTRELPTMRGEHASHDHGHEHEQKPGAKRPTGRRSS